MKFHILPTGMIQTNCVLLSLDDGRTLVIDPGADAPRIRELITTHGLKVVGYPFTHGHYDHVCAIADMHKTHPAPCWMHPLDLDWAFTPRNQTRPWYVQPDPGDLPDIQEAWVDDGPFDIGDFHFQTLYLPGHSPGSVAFYFEQDKLLIGGDVLFKGSVGRTDLPGGDMQTLMGSLRRLARLPADTRVIPGHGPATTIGDEVKSNPFMRQALR